MTITYLRLINTLMTEIKEKLSLKWGASVNLNLPNQTVKQQQVELITAQRI